MEIITCTNDLSRKAGAYLNTALHENENIPILLLLSGGSALSILEFVDFDSMVGNVTVSVLDERYTNDIKGSNFAQVREKMSDTSVQFMMPFPATAENPIEAARFFEASLRNWRSIYPDGVIIATIGMGPDGHTAGIFPQEDNEDSFKVNFVETEKWVYGYTVTSAVSEYPYRVTVTTPFLESQVDHALAFISGKDEKMNELVEDSPLHTMPAQIFKKMKRITVMTDTVLNKK